jgi:hypothetical protein
VINADDVATGLMMLSRGGVERVRSAQARSGMRRLNAGANVHRAVTTRAPPGCVAPATCPGSKPSISHSSGANGPGFFTKNIRRFSIPLGRRLLRLSVTANEVTGAGFALAVLSVLACSLGTFAAGLVGALCCWASIMLAYSGGEVARATLSDLRFGSSPAAIHDR